MSVTNPPRIAVMLVAALAAAFAQSPTPASAPARVPVPPPPPPNYSPFAQDAASVEYRRRLGDLAAADRKRMMDMLKVSEPRTLPPPEGDPKRPANTQRVAGNQYNWTDGVAGHTIVRSSWGNWTNYELAKADTGPLPHPLVLKNGRPVKDAKTWLKKRRPEIRRDFETEIYGRIPAKTPKVTWEIVETDPKALNGTAVMKRIVGHIDNSKYSAAAPSISLTLHLPANATGPVPVIVALTFGFTFRNQPEGPTPLQQVLAKGWGYATFTPTTVQADSGGGIGVGIIGLVSEGHPRRPDDWGAIAAWSWGLSRVIDYFETDMPAPDAGLIAGDIGFRMHEGGHSDLPNWPTFLKFADKYFNPPTK